MLKALKSLPMKLITEKEEFRFTPPEDVTFVTKFQTVDRVKVDRRIEHYTEYEHKQVEVTYESDESSVHSNSAENADIEYSPMKHFDPDEIAEFVNKAPFFKQHQWWSIGINLPGQARKFKLGARIRTSNIYFPSKVYRYLKRLKYVPDGDEANLASKLERYFYPWTKPAPPKKRVTKTKEVYKKLKVNKIREVKTRTEYVDYIYEPVYMNVNKFEGNWVDEMVQLTYKPGFSVIRNEMMPYKKINQDSKKLMFSNKRSKKRNVKKVTKERERAMAEVTRWNDEEIDEMIKENTLLLLKQPDILLEPKKIFELARKIGLSWRASKLVHCALKGMVRNMDPYIFLKKNFYSYKLKKSFDKFHFQSRGGDY
jgi:hypothetical protein